MASFGIGVYFLTIIWFVTLMLCWVSVRTGHYIGKVAIAISVIVTIVLVSLPKGDVEITKSANSVDKLYVLRYATLSLLLLGVIVGSAFSFVHYCLAPIETHKVRNFGSI